MDNTQYRKFLLAKVDTAQREIEIFKGLLSELISGEEVKQEEPKKATAAKKTKPAPQVEEAQAEDADLFSDEEMEAEEPEVTIADVRTAVKNFAAKHGKDKTLKFLAKWKVTAIQDIKKADYTKVIELAQKNT